MKLRKNHIVAAWTAAAAAGLAGAQAGEPPAQTPPDVAPEQAVPPFGRGGGEPIAPEGIRGAGEAGTGAGAIDTRMSSLPPDFEVPGAQLVPEGTYLPRVVGRAVRTARGEVVFAPDAVQPAENSAGLPTPLPLMVLLPSVRRDQIASALLDDPLSVGADTPAPRQASAPRPFAVGGQVYVYHGRSYLLCSTFAAVSGKPASAPKAEQGDAERDAGLSGVDALMKDLEAATEQHRVLTPGTVGVRSREKQDDTVMAALSEGSVVTNRRGRLVRLAEEGGRLAFVVDNDPDSPALPAMVLLPCQVLEEIEAVAAARGTELPVKMSGRVVTSGSKASLLPVFFQVERRTDITPGQ